jgi:hypothetical protein
MSEVSVSTQRVSTRSCDAYGASRGFGAGLYAAVDNSSVLRACMPSELSTVDVTDSKGPRENEVLAMLDTLSREIAGLILPWSQSSLPIRARRSRSE